MPPRFVIVTVDQLGVVLFSFHSSRKVVLFRNPWREEGNKTAHVADNTEAVRESGVASDSQLQTEGTFLLVGKLTEQDSLCGENSNRNPCECVLRSSNFGHLQPNNVLQEPISILRVE